MLRQAPRSTRPSTLFPYTKLVRSGRADGCGPTDGPSSRLPPTVARQRSPTTRRPTSRQITVEMVRTTLEHAGNGGRDADRTRSEEHTSELQSLMRISYAVFCLKKKKKTHTKKLHKHNHHDHTKN